MRSTGRAASRLLTPDPFSRPVPFSRLGRNLFRVRRAFWLPCSFASPSVDREDVL